LRSEVGARKVEHLQLARTEVIDVGAGEVNDAIAEYEASPDVAFAEPNYYYRAAAIPDDARFANTWGLHNSGQTISGVTGTVDADIDATEAWEATTGSRSVVVAIADSGVAYDHPDLARNIWTNPGESGGGRESNGIDDDGNGYKDDWRGWDFVGDDNAPRDHFGHGSHVAGTIGAVGNNGSGTAGVNWAVSLMPLRVLDSQGVGTTADVASAIAYAAAKGADIVNLSVGGRDLSLSVLSAVQNASDVLISAAAGNEGSNNDATASYPCNYSAANIICVAATDQSDRLAGYSNYGAVNVDLAAPGSNVLSTSPPFVRALKEGFESDISATWIAGGTGTTWSRDLDALGYFATDSPTAQYEANSDTWLRTAEPISLSGQDACQLTYVFSLDTEADVDFFEVDASEDGSVWTRVARWSGSTGGDWLTATHDLSSFDDSSMYLRFRLTSNLVINKDGVSIDDAVVKCVARTFSGSEFSYLSGTSMATPHVAGVAALALAAAPGTSTAALKDALVAGVDQLPGLTGKTASSGRLNAVKVLVNLGVAVSDVKPTTSPSPVASPSASPSASPTIPVDPPVLNVRTVSLVLRHHLTAKGRVSSDTGETACIADVVVTIKRNGTRVKRTATSAEGRFSVRIADRWGRYKAVISASPLQGGSCSEAKSPIARHSH
jgi:subtilisin family serine protease